MALTWDQIKESKTYCLGLLLGDDLYERWRMEGGVAELGKTKKKQQEAGYWTRHREEKVYRYCNWQGNILVSREQITSL